MSAPSPIFVAGTGRSGTSQLAHILGEHPQIHRIPIETRFIVDPGGLKTTVDLTDKRYVQVRAEDLAANWPEQRRALFELLGVDDFATRSRFQSHSLENRNDQFDRETREFVERTLDGVIPAMGYA